MSGYFDQSARSIESRCVVIHVTNNTLPQINLATLDGPIVDPCIAAESEMRDALKVQGAQT